SRSVNNGKVSNGNQDVTTAAQHGADGGRCVERVAGLVKDALGILKDQSFDGNAIARKSQHPNRSPSVAPYAP
ncbi:MAG: hypothetical protein WCS52_14720, partial [bacterium]